MGKSSSSLKKKHSKKSSKAQKSSKSKSRRYRKKEQRKFDHDDSASLSSSSEDSYTVKRVQTHTKREVRGRRKRTEKRSYCGDSSDDSRNVRKRKRSKRKNDYEVREKSRKKKKIRREASVSSMSSGSQSCSTCQGGTASGDDSEFENHRGRSGRKEEENTRLERGRSGSRKSSRYGAQIRSSCSHSSESFGERKEKYMLENNSRRLRSVITVTNEDEKGGELCRNQYKEEIVDDHDYPCRSNDSNDGGCKRELDHGLLPALEERVGVEDEKGGVDTGFDSTRDRRYNDRSQYRRNNVYVAGTSESIEKETSENSGGSLDGDDLESILRQKALENLRKFRGEIQSTEKAIDQKNNIASVRLPSVRKKYEQIVVNTISNNVSVEADCDKEALVKETSRPARKSPNGNKGKLESVKLPSIFAQEKVINADSETGLASMGYRIDNPELFTSESHHHSLKNCSSLKQKHAAGPLEEGSVDKRTFDSAQTVDHTSNDNVKNVSELRSAAPKPSCPIPIVRNNNLNKEQDGVKEDFQVELKQTYASIELPDSKSLVIEGDVDKNSAMDARAAIHGVNDNSRDNNSSGENSLNNQGSQFEQKTMNVMRGGEMVQVSYKVYIPKKAPALGRRQLKR